MNNFVYVFCVRIILEQDFRSEIVGLKFIYLKKFGSYY